MADAGVPDAGAPDAGAPDAAVPDAGPFDAGRPDAGSGDAGCLGFEYEDGGCGPLSFTEVCALQTLTVLTTGVPIDDQAAGRLGLALQANCAPTPTLRTVAVADAGVITAQGAPLVGRGEALVCGGGGFYQKHVDWLERTGVTAVLDTSSSSVATFSLRDGGAVFSTPYAQFDGGFDYFIVELVRSAPRGPISLVGYGIFGSGTTAAAWFFEHRVAPVHGTFTDSWYVVRWNEVDGDGVPSAGDDYTVLASGR